MIQAAIVGCGNIAHSHVEGLLAFPDRCRIAALCDIYPEKAEKMKQKYGLDCPVFDDHEKMLASGLKIDLVHVCTPPYVHAQIAIHAMDAGMNTVVEKPMATCLEECDAMLEAEKRNGVTMACIAQNRFRNSIYKLKQTVDSGLAGKVCFAQVNSLWWRAHCYYDLWWRGTWEKEGGGPTLNHAVHHIDMLNWIKGTLPDEVTAMLTNVMHDNSEVEDLSVACMRYADGSLAEVTSSVSADGAAGEVWSAIRLMIMNTILATTIRSRTMVMIFFFPSPPQQQGAADSAGVPQQQGDSVVFVSGEAHWPPQSHAGAERNPTISSGVDTLPGLTIFPFTARAGVIMTPNAVI